MELWILNFIRKFRQKLDQQEYKNYKSLFPAFMGAIPYLNLEVFEIYYGDVLSHYDLRLFKGSYGDKVSLYHSLKLMSTPFDLPQIEVDNIVHQNDEIERYSYLEPLDFDEEGRVSHFDFIYPEQHIQLEIGFIKLNVDDVVDKHIEKRLLAYFLENPKESIDSELEEIFKKAIELAGKCIPEDSEIRPKVSAILIENTKIVVTAFRGELQPGEHAEFTLLRRKIKDYDFTNSTLITTLEPCTVRSSKKTPCADLIIESGIEKVIIGTLDPNPDVRGKGFTYLQNHGISVTVFEDKYARKLIEMNKEFWEIHFSKYKKDIMKV